VDSDQNSHELILMHMYNQINTSKDVLFDFCLRLLNLFIKKWFVVVYTINNQFSPVLGCKFLKMIDSKFIADQLPKVSDSNRISLISLFLMLHKSVSDEQKQEVEKVIGVNNSNPY
jgi:hypothetical protein